VSGLGARATYLPHFCGRAGIVVGVGTLIVTLLIVCLIRQSRHEKHDSMVADGRSVVPTTSTALSLLAESRLSGAGR